MAKVTTLKQALAKIKKNFDTLKSQSYGLSEAVWVAYKDKSSGYDTDIERVGVNKEGQFIWAYASGCSCWDGDYSEDTAPTIKELVAESALPEWEAAVIKFADTNEEQSLD